MAEFVAGSPGGSFDVVTAVGGFEFTPDLPGLLDGVRRIVAPGGHLVLTYEPVLAGWRPQERRVETNLGANGLELTTFRWEPGEVAAGFTGWRTVRSELLAAYLRVTTCPRSTAGCTCSARDSARSALSGSVPEDAPGQFPRIELMPPLRLKPPPPLPPDPSPGQVVADLGGQLADAHRLEPDPARPGQGGHEEAVAAEHLVGDPGMVATEKATPSVKAPTWLGWTRMVVPGSRS